MKIKKLKKMLKIINKYELEIFEDYQSLGNEYVKLIDKNKLLKSKIKKLKKDK